MLTLTVVGLPGDSWTDVGTAHVGNSSPMSENVESMLQYSWTVPLNPFTGVMVTVAAFGFVTPEAMFTKPPLVSEYNGEAVTMSGTESVVVIVEVEAEVAVTVTE